MFQNFPVVVFSNKVTVAFSLGMVTTLHYYYDVRGTSDFYFISILVVSSLFVKSFKRHLKCVLPSLLTTSISALKNLTRDQYTKYRAYDPTTKGRGENRGFEVSKTQVLFFIVKHVLKFTHPTDKISHKSVNITCIYITNPLLKFSVPLNCQARMT